MACTLLHTLFVSVLFLGLAIAQYAPITLAPIMVINSPHYGRSIRSQGFVISNLEAYWEGATKSECACRMLCWSHPDCAGFSVHPHGDERLCRVVIVGPHELTLEENAEGTFTFWTRTIPNHKYEIKLDSLMYLIPREELSFAESKAFCERIPGHRLAIIDTNMQFRILKAFHVETGKEIWIDLHNSPEGPKWGDGEPLNHQAYQSIIDGIGSSLENTIPLRIRTNDNGKILLDDFSPDKQKSFLCQANPYGIIW